MYSSNSRRIKTNNKSIEFQPKNKKQKSELKGNLQLIIFFCFYTFINKRLFIFLKKNLAKHGNY
jgi:hypothetical protein